MIAQAAGYRGIGGERNSSRGGSPQREREKESRVLTAPTFSALAAVNSHIPSYASSVMSSKSSARVTIASRVQGFGCGVRYQGFYRKRV